MTEDERKRAEAERVRAYRNKLRGGPPHEPLSCGTYAAARRHLRNGVKRSELDPACKTALAEEQHKWYVNRRDRLASTSASHPEGEA